VNREQLEHALRAAGAISGDRELYVVGNPNTNGFRGLCLDPGDLALSKLAAGRPKDIAYLKTMLRERMLTIGILEQRRSAWPRSLLSPGRNRPS